MFPGKDLSGIKFNNLQVIKKSGRDKLNNITWLCQCDCGKQCHVCSTRLISGHTKSCGCLVRKTLSAIRTTHAMSYTSEYKVWVGIKSRCTNPKSTRFENYGGRGILISEDWLLFSNFYGDMGPRPSPLHSIDRINNDGNYEKNNCRWATMSEQANNRRNSKLLFFNNKNQTVSQWSQELGIPTRLIYRRLSRGWTPQKTFTTPNLQQGIAL